LIIWGITFGIRKLTVSKKWAIGIACMIFAVGAGIAAALKSHVDSSILFNFPAVFLGDFIYRWSIQLLGDPSSFQAHYTIPWIFRGPQVYVLASIIIWGPVGLVIQLIYNRFLNRPADSQNNLAGEMKPVEKNL
jgi:hypothetical protein